MSNVKELEDVSINEMVLGNRNSRGALRNTIVVFLHNDFDFSVHRLVVGSLFYLCMIGVINYTIYKRNTRP